MTEIDRRALLKRAAAGTAVAGAVWATPAVLGGITPAAALSGQETTSTTNLYKATSGTNSTDIATQCLNGTEVATTGTENGQLRGSVSYSRNETVSPAQICATITINSGPDNTGREVYLLQANSSGCLGPTDQLGMYVPAGTWAATPQNGPQTFCQDIIPGADTFVLLIWQSGGSGTNASSTIPITLP